MARRDAIMKLKQDLIARREELKNLLAEEWLNLQDFAADTGGDSADMAFAAGCDEMSSTLAELDARELAQIERVLARMDKGTYGVCEGESDDCQRRIPIARLNALPYATHCINCEREREKTAFAGPHRPGNWAQVDTFRPAKDDSRMNISKLELALPSHRRG